MSLCAPTFFHLGAHVLLGGNISVEPDLVPPLPNGIIIKHLISTFHIIMLAAHTMCRLFTVGDGLLSFITILLE